MRSKWPKESRSAIGGAGAPAAGGSAGLPQPTCQRSRFAGSLGLGLVALRNEPPRCSYLEPNPTSRSECVARSLVSLDSAVGVMRSASIV